MEENNYSIICPNDCQGRKCSELGGMLNCKNCQYKPGLKYFDNPSFDPPSKKPHRCPICGGNGIVPNGFYNRIGDILLTDSTITEPCRSCGGTGIVWG